MDVGIFKASKVRLMAWIAIPPALILGVGLGSYAWHERAAWRLKEAKALEDVLPAFIGARADAEKLVAELGLENGNMIANEDQLLSVINEAAARKGFIIESMQVERKVPGKGQDIPLLVATVEGSGKFTAIQLFANELVAAHKLLSVSSIALDQPRDDAGKSGLFEVRITFELMQIDEVLQTAGGVQ